MWSEDILGRKRIKRQFNYEFSLLTPSGTSGERSDTAEFLTDFTLWVDEMNAARQAPIFGDEPQEERMWVTGAGFLAEWDGTTSSVYAMRVHIQSVKYYEPIQEEI